MQVEFLSWASSLLVVASILVKILTAHVVATQKQELAKLQAEARRQRVVLESLEDHRESLANNLEFLERRLEESTEVRGRLQEEMGALAAVWHKHVESLGHDPDAALGAAGTAPTAAAPAAHEYRGDGGLGAGAVIAVVPASVGDADKLFLPDAIVTQLLAGGVHVIERSLLAQRLRDRGDDLGRVLDREEYPKMAGVGVDAVVIANSRMRGSGVGSATCRVVHLPSGGILLSTSYDQPGRDEADPAFESLTQTARRLADSVRGILQPQAASP